MSDFYNYIRQIRSEGSLREVDWYDTANEVIRLMYSTLGWLVRDGWETLSITNDHVLYGRGGVLHEHFDEVPCKEARAIGRDDCTTFREAMRLIYQHDELVRQHFQLVEETLT
jgi:hypothetical protein